MRNLNPLDRSRVSFELEATDTPRLLILEEQATPAPTNLKAQAGLSRVALSWAPAPNAAHHQVQRATHSGGPYVPIASGLTNNWFLDTDAANGTTYFYVVSAADLAPSSEIWSPFQLLLGI